jgi:glutathione S-transferase
MLTVHHLGKSQSERIVWLCEELGLAYELRLYARDPVTRLAPPDYRALHPLGIAPVITDGDLVLAESGAIVDYIIAKHGHGRLRPDVNDPSFADYLFWFHFANGTLQPAMGRAMTLRRADVPADSPVAGFVQERLDRALNAADTRLEQAQYIAGADFTAADIMIVFSLTTMRLFLPLALGPYANIRAYLQRIGVRPGYRRAMEKGDPDMTPLLT